MQVSQFIIILYILKYFLTLLLESYLEYFATL